MTLVLATQYRDSIPLEVEGVTPDITRDKTLTEIEKLQVFQGNRQGVLADFFSVSGDPSDARIQWQGNLSSVHWIGAGMTAGQMTIEGSAGRHVGSRMRAGQIDVVGDVSDWVGAEMLGGMIHVRGNAAHLVGAGYRGSARGMSGGTLLVQGNAGNEVGHTMRRGFVAIGGNIGDLAGMNMLAGSLLVFGRGGIRHGAGMRRGTIALLGEESPAQRLAGTRPSEPRLVHSASHFSLRLPRATGNTASHRTISRHPRLPLSFSAQRNGDRSVQR